MDLESLKQEISKLKSESSALIDSSNDQGTLDKTYKSYLGKNGEVNLLLKSLGSLPQEKRKEAGMLLNQLKSDIDNSYKDKTSELSKAENELRLGNQKIDISLPSTSKTDGSVHPVTQTIFHTTPQKNASVILQPHAVTASITPIISDLPPSEFYSFSGLQKSKYTFHEVSQDELDKSLSGKNPITIKTGTVTHTIDSDMLPNSFRNPVPDPVIQKPPKPASNPRRSKSKTKPGSNTSKTLQEVTNQPVKSTASIIPDAMLGTILPY